VKSSSGYLQSGELLMRITVPPVMQYYSYVLETPLALTGSHNLAKATAKGNTVVLFVASANDKQWPASQKVLKAVVDSFQV
jgi:hypothetical protein